MNPPICPVPQEAIPLPPPPAALPTPGPESIIQEARKKDLAQVDAAARQIGVDRKKFGDYIHKLKSDFHMKGDDNFTFEELLEYAKEFKEKRGK